MDWQKLTTLEAERVRLRELNDNDIDALFTIFSNPQVMRYWSTAPFAAREDAIALLSQIRDNFSRRQYLKWGVALTSDNSIIGTATLFNLNLENQRAEVGYALAREQWGKGLMNEALRRLLQYAFDDLKLRRLEADVDPRNTGSIKTLERLGFQREGYLRERWHVCGEIQDALFYGLLQSEWKG
jgi:RimJ/RimL family protein N-acetyltransferase